ncbi:MAG: dTMP kinase, partial [Gemmatimonadota bacterium]
RGLFLVLEGIEGSGKTTQARMLAAWLEERGIPHLATREPGGTAVGEEARRLLLEAGSMDARTELLLMLAARAALVAEVIEPALAEGRLVLADRFDLSTFAYQAYGRGLPLDTVHALNRFATGGLRPDLTVLLDVPRGVGERRRAARSVQDRIERAGAGFHERVARAYRELAEREPDVERLDGTEEAVAVHASLRALLSSRFPETFGRIPG